MKKLLTLFCIVALATSLCSCTAINPYTGEQQVSRATIGTGIGAAGGALIGGLAGGGRGALIGAAAGGIVGGITGNYMDRQNTELRQQLLGTGVQVIKRGNSIQLRMASDVTFKLNSADIRSQFYSTLRSVAVVLQKYNRTNIVVNGYTDNTGTQAYNQRLSERRAASVGSFLVSQGLNSNRIFTRGYGQRYPIATNNTKRGRALNRRVVIVLRQMG